MLVAAVMLASCGGKSGYFRLEGRLRHMNQAAFYIYSLDGGMQGLDTIQVKSGIFSYEIPLEHSATFVLVFPNYSEQPIFAEPGAKVSIEGDASHLRELKITGTKDNELMTEWRLKANNMTPPGVRRSVGDFVKEHPESPVGRYLVDAYLVKNINPNYEEAYSLSKIMLDVDKDNIWLQKMNKSLSELKKSYAKLPPFKGIDTNGKRVNKDQLNKRVNIIYTYSSWSRASSLCERVISRFYKNHPNDVAVLGISLDANPRECKKRVESDSLKWSVVCDGKAWDSPIVKDLGIAVVPATIITDRNGKVVARNLRDVLLEQKLEELSAKN